MFSQEIPSIIGTPFKRGARGFSHGLRGLGVGVGDDGPLGIPGVFAYTLATGTVVYLPSEWNSMTSVQKLLWIQTSNLSAADSIQLETEAGVSTPPIGPNPITGLPPAGSTPPPTPSNLRPTFDYVRAGDVVRVTIPLQSGIYLAQGDVLSAIANAVRGSNLNYINGSTPGLFGGSLAIDVQAGNDFSHLADIASIVQTAAQGVGGIVASGPASGAFVSKVEATGGTMQAQQVPPNTNAGSHPLDTLSKSLNMSSSNLLLLGGAGVLLLVVLAKK